MRIYLKNLFFLSLFITNVSCSSNNKEGVKEITDFYGGICTVGYGKMYKNMKKVDFIKINLRNSEYLEYFKSDLSLPASNIATILFRNLKDKNKYSEVRVELKLKDTVYKERIFSSEIIKILNKKIIYDKLFAMIIKHK